VTEVKKKQASKTVCGTKLTNVSSN